MEKYEVIYIPEISQDFLEASLPEKRVLSIHEKMEFIAFSPWQRTEGLQGKIV